MKNIELLPQSIGVGILAGTLLSTLRKFRTEGRLTIDYQGYVKAAINYINCALEEKINIDKADILNITLSSFSKYRTALNASVPLESYFENNGVTEIDGVLSRTKLYLEAILSGNPPDENTLEWVEKFFTSLNRVCLVESGYPIERGPRELKLKE